MGEVHRIVTGLELPGTIDDRASTIARDLQTAGLYVGDNLDAGAAVYAACRCADIIRPVVAIADVDSADADGIIRVYRKTIVHLDLQPALIRPTDWVPQFVDALGLDGDVRRAALRWAQQAEANPTAFGGSPPSGIAAACIYPVTGKTITQDRLGDVSGTSPATMRKRVADLEGLD